LPLTLSNVSDIRRIFVLLSFIYLIDFYGHFQTT
jgi:hypothetical protein